jgi:hypothetical protein
VKQIVTALVVYLGRHPDNVQQFTWKNTLASVVRSHVLRWVNKWQLSAERPKFEFCGCHLSEFKRAFQFTRMPVPNRSRKTPSDSTTCGMEDRSPF